jgi:hypothetical protein
LFLGPLLLTQLRRPPPRPRRVAGRRVSLRLIHCAGRTGPKQCDPTQCGQWLGACQCDCVDPKSSPVSVELSESRVGGHGPSHRGTVTVTVGGRRRASDPGPPVSLTPSPFGGRARGSQEPPARPARFRASWRLFDDALAASRVDHCPAFPGEPGPPGRPTPTRHSRRCPATIMAQFLLLPS